MHRVHYVSRDALGATRRVGQRSISRKSRFRAMKSISLMSLQPTYHKQRSAVVSFWLQPPVDPTRIKRHGCTCSNRQCNLPRKVCVAGSKAWAQTRITSWSEQSFLRLGIRTVLQAQHNHGSRSEIHHGSENAQSQTPWFNPYSICYKSLWILCNV